jgi:hypothetical protein
MACRRGIPSPPLVPVPNASGPSKNDAAQTSTSAIAEGGKNNDEAGSDIEDGSDVDDEDDGHGSEEYDDDVADPE